MVNHIIELSRVSKTYNLGETNEVNALTDINLQIPENSMVCLKGASGSGKSTLLAIIGCLFPPTSGRATIAGKLLSRLPDRFMTIHRRNSIGFIFQQFNILPDLTVRDNITLPLIPLGVEPSERNRRASRLMEKFNISHRQAFPARQISGGELQRVAIARALINEQPIILADEPTAHLDTKLSKEFLGIMNDLKAGGKTIIIASHDPLVTENPLLDRIIDIKDGRIDVP
ncbi:MAG: ABC transporter ATP-binding protein [Proteobacteria bacterium]|nr:ABC transporter ATP-binding protein [Pseudomonadota bacterium]MBU1739373.1 ABC transporter ATP-binding protein [Pseudomonadota bacterium]